jgi:hypothetical protein
MQVSVQCRDCLAGANQFGSEPPNRTGDTLATVNGCEDYNAVRSGVRE